MFRQMDLKGKTKDDTKLETVHQNAITTIRAYDGGPGRLAKFSSMFSLSMIVTMLMVQQQVALMAV
jgi:hypothetical protein